MSTESHPPDWVTLGTQSIWYPYTQMQLAPAPLAIERGGGVYLYTADGRRILDGISSWWVNIHGHSHPRLNGALARQAARLEHVIFAGTLHEPAARLAAALLERVTPGLSRVFYSDNGSTAVEVAVKMAYQYWRNRGEPRRRRFVCLDHGYHGDTIGSVSVSGVDFFQDRFDDLVFDVLRAHAPYCYGHGAGGAVDTTTPTPHCGRVDSQDIEAVLAKHGDEVAGVIIEPMLQGAGGMLVWPREFLQRVASATQAAGTLLIADEVFTGFGRTGKFLACEHGPVAPDLLCLSKAITGGYLPLAVTLASDQVYEGFLSEDRNHALLHGHSYTANPLACAVALESLALFDENRCLERIGRLATLFEERLERLRTLERVTAVRSIGGMAAFEVKPSDHGGYLDDAGQELAAAFLGRGVLLRPLGNVFYFLPPYVITDEEAHEVFDVVEEVLGRG